MTITKRTDKGSALTFAEMDENIRDLREDTDLTRVLTNGSNTTLDLSTTGTITADTFIGTLISANSASEIDINTINAANGSINELFSTEIDTTILRTTDLTSTNITANTIVTDNITVRDPGPAFVIHKLNTQSIADTVATDVNFTAPDQAIKLDTHGGWDTSQFIYYVCQESGWYQVDQTVVIDDGSAQARDFIIAFLESSDGGSSYESIGANGTRYATNDVATPDLVITGLFYLTNGNYYKIKAYYNSTEGGSGNIIINTDSIQGTPSDMDGNGTLTRWSMYKVMD
jgi:hypothetical protein